MNCKNCAHYDVSDPNRPTCHHPKFKFGYYGIESVNDIDADGLAIEDDEGWGWIVGPEFGCVHFEQR